MMATLLVLLLTPASARAAAYDDAAKTRLAEGDVSMAVVEWERAFAADPDPRFLLAMARALASKPSRCVAAGDVFARFQAACGSCTLAAEGRRAFGDARCTGEIRVSGASLEIDGAPARSPARLWAGVHTLAAVRGGGRREITWCVAPGTTAAVAFDGRSPIEVDVSGDASARAFAHQEAGLAHAGAGRFCAAVREFDRAHHARPEPGFLYNQALAYDHWRGQCAEALRAFDRFLAGCPGCPQADDARARRKRIMGECAGTLEVVTTPRNAQVRVAGKSGAAPLKVRILPGRHRVHVSAPSHEAMAFEAPVDLDHARTIEFVLVPVSAAAPVSPPPPKPPVSNDKPWKWVALTVGAVGFGTAGFFSWQAQQDLDEFDRLLALAERNDDVSYRGDLLESLDTFERNRAIAYLGWGVGAAGAVTGAVLWLLEGTRGEQTAWRLVPAPSGLGVARAF